MSEQDSKSVRYMPISPEQAFSDLHSLDVREALRRFQPKIMLVAVNSENDIVKTEQFKSAPEVEDLHRFGEDCKGTAIFIAHAENYKDVKDFEETVLRKGAAIRRRQKSREDSE